MQGDLVAHSALQHGGGEHRGLVGARMRMVGSQHLMNEMSGWLYVAVRYYIYIYIYIYIDVCKHVSRKFHYI